MSKSEEIANNILNNVKTLEKKASLYDEYIETQGALDGIKSKADRFYSKALTADVVAKLHDQSKPTVLKYVKLGLIPKHPNSRDTRILIRASDAIVLDFVELQHKSKYL